MESVRSRELASTHRNRQWREPWEKRPRRGIGLPSSNSEFASNMETCARATRALFSSRPEHLLGSSGPGRTGVHRHATRGDPAIIAKVKTRLDALRDDETSQQAGNPSLEPHDFRPVLHEDRFCCSSLSTPSGLSRR